MAGFVMRKNDRFKKLVPMHYAGDRIAGEGMIEHSAERELYVRE